MSIAPSNADGEGATGGQLDWAPPPVRMLSSDEMHWDTVKPPILDAIQSGVQRALHAGLSTHCALLGCISALYE